MQILLLYLTIFAISLENAPPEWMKYREVLINTKSLSGGFPIFIGSPKDTIIAIGDFEQKQHRKFKEPIKGKGFRSLFRRYGYKVYLVDEHKTSCRCANCGCETTTFRWCQNPKYWKENIIKRHGLLRCKNGCGLWNRDTNGAINIWKIAVEAIFQRERPEYLKRTKRSISGVTSTLTTQDLHEDPFSF